MLRGFGDEVGFEVFYQAIFIREEAFEMAEAVLEVEFAKAGNGFFEVKDEARSDLDVFYVHHG